MSFFAGSLKETFDYKSFDQRCHHGDNIEYNNQTSRNMLYFHKNDINQHEKNSAGIRLDQIFIFGTAVLITFWFIKIELSI